MLGLIFALPFILLLIVCSPCRMLGTVALGLWPTDLSVDVPLSLARFGGRGSLLRIGCVRRGHQLRSDNAAGHAGRRGG